MAKLGKLPTGLMKRRVDARSSENELIRVTETSNDAGEIVENKETITRTLWPFTPTVGTVQSRGGERSTGAIEALARPSEDIRLDDQLTHNGIDYEVDGKTSLPSADAATVIRYTLVRRDGP